MGIRVHKLLGYGLTDLFTDDKVWLQLRPVLYTYWS